LKEAGLYDQFLKVARPEGEVLKIYDPYNRILMDENENVGVGRPAEMHGRPEIDRVLLRGLLLDSLDADSVKWGYRLQRVEAAENNKYDLHFNSGIERGFDLVVGADGAWSKVRPLVSDTVPFYSGVTGLDVRVTDADNRHPDLAKRVGNGMCLTLGENKGILSQRNGGGTLRIYAFLRSSETWYKDCGIDWTQSESAKKELLKRHYDDWSQEAKDLVLKSDPEVTPRPMYMLPIGFKWTHRPG
jgi:2-polyprenyl-6-methoxyphenol hydroxylase-like FAD-dependent oxidoreductase